MTTRNFVYAESQTEAGPCVVRMVPRCLKVPHTPLRNADSTATAAKNHENSGVTNRADRAWVGADSNRSQTCSLTSFAARAWQDSNPPDASVLRRGILAPLTVFAALVG
jgi:hypothetical protein